MLTVSQLINVFLPEVVENGSEVVESHCEVVENGLLVVEKALKVVEKYLVVVDFSAYLQCFHSRRR